MASGGLSAAPIENPHIWREIVLARSRLGRTPAAVEIVAQELADQVRRAVTEGRWPSAQVAAVVPAPLESTDSGSDLGFDGNQ